MRTEDGWGHGLRSWLITNIVSKGCYRDKHTRWDKTYLLMGWKGDNKYKAFSAENLKETENTIIFYVRNIWRKTLPKYCPSFADNDERLLVCIVWVNVTDGSAGELEWKLTIPPRQIIACNYERHHRLGCGESIGSQQTHEWPPSPRIM